MSLRYYISDSNNPYYNLATERYLFDSKKNGDIIIYLWQNKDTVVVGRYQNTYEEIDLKYARQGNIAVARRDTGGGAVYHDLGNLNYTFIVDENSGQLASCNNLLKSVFKYFGLRCVFQGRNDILINGFKISGTAQHIESGKLLHHGTLLISSNLEILENVLTRNNKIINSKAKCSNRRRVANLSEFIKIDVDDVFETYTTLLRSEDGREIEYLDEERISIVKDNKYSTNDWIYGFQPKFSYKSSMRLKSGTITALAVISNGVIEKVQFEGDFFTVGNLFDFENALCGMKINEKMAESMKIINGDMVIKGASSKDIASLFDDLRE